MRGEKWTIDLDALHYKGSPPRARGEGVVLRDRQFFRGITPACAGRSSLPPASPWPPQDHPRVRGEKVPICRSVVLPLGSPPRARGEGLASGIERIAGGITPACAGRSQTSRTARCPPPDHPRVRGEKSGSATMATVMSGSPPRARGEVSPASVPPAETRITPACAGRSERYAGHRHPQKDHPRVRGEKRRWTAM